MIDTQQSDDPFFDQFQPAPPPPGSTPAPPGSAPAPGAAPAPTGTAPGGLGRDAFGQAWLASGGRTVDDLKRFVAAHPEYGVKLGGTKGDKVYGPDGTFWADAVMSAGTGGTGALWDTSTGGGSSGGGMLGAMGPWMQPYDKTYTLPTADELAKMPGYQAGMDAFNRASQNSAAAHGMLLNGRTNQAMNAAAGDYAMQNYGMLASLGKSAFDTNYGIFRNNQNDPFDKAYRTAQLGKPGA
jgi:hypothetical protein